MASVDCAKYTSGAAKILSVHFDAKERLEREHSNPHINKTLTPLNSFYDASGYQEMLNRQNKIVESTDALYPPERVRKDRVTCIMVDIPVPQKISDKGKTNEFLADAYKILQDKCGKQYCCGMAIHKDEVHDYYDSRKGCIVTSLEHGHAMVVPFATWKGAETVKDDQGKPLRDENGKFLKQEVERKGINGKNFTTKAFFKELQDQMQEMCLERYGMSYQTQEEPRKMSVEELKHESARAEMIIDKAEMVAEQTVSQAHEKVKSLDGQIKKSADQLNKLAGVSHALSDPERTEPIHISLQDGKSVSYMPVPELQKQSKDLEIDIKDQISLKDDLKAQIDELDLSRNNLSLELERLQNELLEIQKLGKYLATYEKSQINIYETEIPDGFMRKKSVVVVESDLHPDQVHDIFKSNSIRQGIIEETKDIIRQGQEEVDQMRNDAADIIRQAQAIQNQRDQILQDTEQERKSIIAKAEELAKEIIANLQETIRDLKEQIAELLNLKNERQKEADQIISAAKEEAENIKLVAKENVLEDRFSSASAESKLLKIEKVLASSPELQRHFEQVESSMNQAKNHSRQK